MFKRIVTTAALVLGMAGAAPPVAGAQQVVCGSRDEVVTRLGQEFGESRRGGGLVSPTAIFELFASDKTGTWTILRTGTDGMSCVMVMGESWEDDFEPIVRAGSPV